MSSSDEENFKLSSKVNLNCRYYLQRFPSVNDLVMVEVLRMEQVGAYVSLLEYNGMEGLIMLSDLTRKRIKSISQLTRTGRKEVVAVIRVDESKSCLDLSKKQVTAEDISECEKKYQKAKSVNNILRHVAQTTSTDIEKLYESIGWPLYEKFEHALDAFRLAVTEPDKVLEGLHITPEIRESLLNVIRNRLTPQAVRISAEFSVTCFEYEGIESIKQALEAGRDLDPEKIKIRLIAAPLFSLVLTTVNKAQGVELAKSCLDKIAEVIQKLKGKYVVKELPHVIDNDARMEHDELFHNCKIDKGNLDFEEDYDKTMGDVDLGFEGVDVEAKNADIQDDD
jgi:translation initiation factor 2 subunit 1